MGKRRATDHAHPVTVGACALAFALLTYLMLGKLMSGADWGAVWRFGRDANLELEQVGIMGGQLAATLAAALGAALAVTWSKGSRAPATGALTLLLTGPILWPYDDPFISPALVWLGVFLAAALARLLIVRPRADASE